MQTFCYITGSAVMLHCGKAHVQSQWEMANFDPYSIKIPEIYVKIRQVDHIPQGSIGGCSSPSPRP